MTSGDEQSTSTAGTGQEDDGQVLEGPESAESLGDAVEQLHVRRISEVAVVGDQRVVSV